MDYVEEKKYLTFYVGDEIFGVPLLGVREVVEMQAIKKIPNTVKQFLGVMNVRGEIVGVVDLRLRFNVPAEDRPLMAMIIFDSVAGPMAAIVDRVEAVLEIQDKEIEENPNISTDFPLEFLIGIAKFKERLITLLDLNQVLGAETLNDIRKSKMGNIRN